MPFKDLFERTNKVLESLESNLPIILPHMTELSTSLNNVALRLEKMTPEGQKVLLKTNRTLDNANVTLMDISAAARSIKNLTDYLERHPEAILKGKEK